MREITEGTLLGGKLRYRQFADGHRSGFEPVLLAAAADIKPGDYVLEAGTGAGAALLCLSHRVPNIHGVGLDIDFALSKIANENFKINNLGRFYCVTADALAPPFGPIFDHALANPPWFDPASTKSPDAPRALAHHSRPGLLAAWGAGMTNCLKPNGKISFILPSALLGEAIALLKSLKFGGIVLVPLWPRENQPAKQFIVTAKRGSKMPDVISAGLILHDQFGITPQADEILRNGAPLIHRAAR